MLRYFADAFTNFMAYSNEFGIGAALKIFRNNRTSSTLKSLRVRGYPHPLYYRQATTDLPVMRLIIGQENVFKELVSPKLIIDAGANVGYVSVFYANRYPGAEVISVEMERENFDVLQKNVAAYRNVKAVHAALWEHSRGIEFSSASGTDSYSVVDNKEPDRKVASVTLIELAGKKGSEIDLLKIDIEGAEVEILNFMKANSIVPRQLVVELHDRFRPGCSAALESYLEGKSHTRTKIYEYEVIRFH